MKKILIILLLLLTTTIVTAQSELSIKIDVKNAVYGSKVNKPAFNYKISFSDQYNGWHNTRLGFFFEQFKEIEYIQIGTKIDHKFKLLKNINLLTGVEAGIIYRNTTYANNTITYAFNLEVTYKLSKHFKATIQLNKERATDITQLWRNSAYSGLIYQFN